MTAGTDRTPLATRELTITRVFNAPRRLVFRMWVDPVHLAQWWGPHGFTNPVCELDARPGGAIRILMQGPGGVEHLILGTYQEIVAPQRLVFTTTVDDPQGNRLLEGHTVVTFEEHAGRTTLTLQTRASGFAAITIPMLDGMEQGWTQSIERLEQAVMRAGG